MTTTTSTTAPTTLTGERADLLESLRKHRFFLTLPARGLTDDQARLRPTASELCIGGIIKHVTQAERNWVRFIEQGPDAVPDHTAPDVFAEWLDGHTMRDDETLAGIAEASVSALTKIVQVMPPRLRRRVDALRIATTSTTWRTGGASSEVDPAALTAVAQACRDAVRLRFAYTAANGERTEREVEPLRLVTLGRRWYLVAYDLARHDWRSFRLDRLDQPVAGGVRFRPRELPGGDEAEFVRERVTRIPDLFEVVARVQAPADAVRRRIGAWSSVEPAGDDPGGACVVRMTGDQVQWPVLALSMLDAEFTVLGPPELRTHLAEVGARFTRATR